MTETADRYRKVADRLSERVREVPPDAWDRPSPCEGWTTRDVVRHLVETSGHFLGRGGIELPPGPSVDDDPVGAWQAARDGVQAVLDDPARAGIEHDSPMGRSTIERTIGMFGVGDVIIHTWDISRAAGLDDTLDADEVHRLFELMEPNDEMMRQGGAFGPRVPVADDVDEQTKLIAFTGRRP